MSKPNLEAKKERHQKLFEGQYHSTVGKFWFHFKRVLKGAWYLLRPSGPRFSEFTHPLQHWPAPERLYVKLTVWSLGLLMITSVNLAYPSSVGGEGVGQEYLALDSTEGTFLTDEEGFLIKDVPLDGTPTADSNRVEIVDHEVQSGETLSVIAFRYGVKVTSIKYANPTLRSDFLKVGQKLAIPPKDGLYIEVKKGDTIEKIIKSYKGDADKTKEFNGLIADSDLVAGAKIFVVDGQPVAPVYVAGTTTKGTPPVGGTPPANPGGWIRPTVGIITNGYSGGHLAYDIADRSKPAIWAAADGTVIHASSGTWGGGYGNNIIIDHGNGYQTLYAHAEELYVSEGDSVTQGQVVAKMGRTGNVRGVTGIHLHFEVVYNGVKQNPKILGVW